MGVPVFIYNVSRETLGGEDLKKSKIDRANRILNYFDEYGIETNTTRAVKNALEVLNKDYKKRGAQDRFSKSKNALDDNILENLADTLFEENERIKSALKSEDFLQQDDLNEQDYLDYIDTADDIYRHDLASLLEDSDQVQTIYSIIDKKGLKKKDYEKVINREIEKEMQRGFIENGYRSVNPDRLARYIRGSLYKFKDSTQDARYKLIKRIK